MQMNELPTATDISANDSFIMNVDNTTVQVTLEQIVNSVLETLAEEM